MTSILFAAILASALLPSLVSASIVTLAFDQWGSQIIENGYVYENSSSYHHGGDWYFHDDDLGMVGATIKREDGQQFDAMSMDFSGRSFAILTGSQEEISEEGAAGADDYTYGYVQLNGYRDGIQVASETIFQSFSSTITLSSLFSGLTSFEVKLSEAYREQGWSYVDYANPLLSNTVYCRNPGGWGTGCESVRIDNLALRSTPAPVPLPATLPLLMIALGGLGFVARGNDRRRLKLRDWINS